MSESEPPTNHLTDVEGDNHSAGLTDAQLRESLDLLRSLTEPMRAQPAESREIEARMLSELRRVASHFRYRAQKMGSSLTTAIDGLGRHVKR